jgi:hypothetical protein
MPVRVRSRDRWALCNQILHTLCFISSAALFCVLALQAGAAIDKRYARDGHGAQLLRSQRGFGKMNA